ncbi:MAG: endo-1,3-alpha-glucanase family glycosylhydrolase [Planctomycetota bacterium]|nr:endo-1,3-alpha-glucanase family glycosylhydrolase [Planctomycetota bacterium]
MRSGLAVAAVLSVAAGVLAGEKEAAAVPAKMVFAHYMVCIPTYGGGSKLDDYKREIQDAQQRGIDGFALNCGNWRKREPHYHARSTLIYEAAKSLGTDFKVFFSADGVAPEEAADMVFSFYDHPNQFRYKGKPVLSTFAGSTEWGNKIVELIRAAGKEVVFVPYYYPKPASEMPQQSHVDQVFNDNPTLDGFFFFGAAGTGEQIAASNRLLARKWLGAGKVFMADVTPFYRGFGGNYRVYETRGFQALAQEWEGAIKDGATWVEIVTWNDWGESSYVAPFGGPEETKLWNGHWGPLLSHVAYLDASRYYIDWYKSGAPPKIAQDALYYFYRLHPKNVPGIVKPDDKTKKTGLPGGAQKLEDKVFVTLFLTAPAELAIHSGETQKEFEVQAGVEHVELPFAAGKQRFVLKRGGQTVIDKTGEHEISATDAWGDFNYFAGEAKAQHGRGTADERR